MTSSHPHDHLGKTHTHPHGHGRGDRHNVNDPVGHDHDESGRPNRSLIEQMNESLKARGSVYATVEPISLVAFVRMKYPDLDDKATGG